MSFDHPSPAKGASWKKGSYKVDREELSKLKEEWEKYAREAETARAVPTPEDVRRKVASERAQKTAFSSNISRGNTALAGLANNLLTLRKDSDMREAAAAQLYGTALTMQRTAMALAVMMGEPYIQHLSDPDSASVATLKDLMLVNSSLSASTKVMVHVINVFHQVLEGQAQAAERLSDLASLVNDKGVNEAILKSLAHGSAPRGYAKDLETMLDECSPLLSEVSISNTSDNAVDEK